MLLNNRLAPPGSIRRVDLYPNTVRVVTITGEEINYRRVVASVSKDEGPEEPEIHGDDYGD